MTFLTITLLFLQQHKHGLLLVFPTLVNIHSYVLVTTDTTPLVMKHETLTGNKFLTVLFCYSLYSSVVPFQLSTVHCSQVTINYHLKYVVCQAIQLYIHPFTHLVNLSTSALTHPLAIHSATCLSTYLAIARTYCPLTLPLAHSSTRVPIHVSTYLPIQVLFFLHTISLPVLFI